MDKERLQVNITGIVQGVGFRPFVYNLAQNLKLAGWVCNSPKGVEIQVEGDRFHLGEFLRQVQDHKPTLSVIETLETKQISVENDDGFTIKHTKLDCQPFVLISPDICTCEDCLKEVLDPQDKRYSYAFTNCTNCGPRFTIIKNMPYDREQTTMAQFPMCAACSKEYEDPGNRRFHAQPNACPDCGPQMALLDHQGQQIVCDNVIKLTSKMIKAGRIVAIKGLGGYHLACDAQNQTAVKTLRQRKIREEKPFALMVKNVEMASLFCEVGSYEAQLLSNRRRPIVLLRKKSGGLYIADDVAPGNADLGIMLPYTPLHFLLLEEDITALVMTSGNISSEPIIYKDEDAINQLQDIADYFLVHNRPIHRRVDDSVMRVYRRQEYPLRRSRGYAPDPIKINCQIEPILAVGAEQKNAFCLSTGNYLFVSHHIGDLENLETLESFEEGIADFTRMFNIRPKVIAYDLHPEYLSTKYALEDNDTIKVGVQHHHAHIASVMAEHNLHQKVIGVAFDGTGYGLDGKLWGGEFFYGDYKDFHRRAHLAYAPMPGGVKTIKEPWRMAASLLKATYDGDGAYQEIKRVYPKLNEADWQLMWQAAEKGINTPVTSSMGRLFDAVAAILGVRTHVSYEGQAAIELEQWALRGATKVNRLQEICLSFDIYLDEPMIIDWRPLIKQIVAEKQRGTDLELLAWEFHQAVAQVVEHVVIKISQSTGCHEVCLSGGVFQNMVLLEAIVSKLEQAKFSVYVHRKVPTNDGGISLGQVMIAHERSGNRCV